jgi:transcriptional regulator NrdR family protein
MSCVRRAITQAANKRRNVSRCSQRFTTYRFAGRQPAIAEASRRNEVRVTGSVPRQISASSYEELSVT